MNFNELNPPITELPARQIWHRVQRKTARIDSVRVNGFLLAPPDGLTGRFDLADESIAYLGDSPETALYESLFRREVRSCHWDRLQQRVLTCFETLYRLRLVDLRGLEERYPVLQSLRYESTQSFALDCRRQDLDGISMPRPSIRTMAVSAFLNPASTRQGEHRQYRLSNRALSNCTLRRGCRLGLTSSNCSRIGGDVLQLFFSRLRMLWYRVISTQVCAA